MIASPRVSTAQMILKPMLRSKLSQPIRNLPIPTDRSSIVSFLRTARKQGSHLTILSLVCSSALVHL
ncbi:MAG: hypothetical protein CXT68_03610 [Methanobacteriota archaeon]|nr:MAG: hypothetical protein CXT68_03610 [Euryarchaeota archaeon]